MSFLNREKLSVSVYKNTDVDAPQIPVGSTSKGIVRTIIKACLSTGYGDKQGAGWDVAFEDLDEGVTVLSTKESDEQKFYLRLSADDGKQITPQVYLNMTDIDTGSLKLQCHTTFKYGTAGFNGKWLLIATSRGFWLFVGHKYANEKSGDVIGSYMYCGDTVKNTQGQRAIILKHTGGDWGLSDDDRSGIFGGSNSSKTDAKIYIPHLDSVSSVSLTAFWLGDGNKTTNALLAQICTFASSDIYQIPAFAPSRRDKVNFDEIMTEDGRRFINHGHGLGYQGYIFNMYIPIDFWEL